jgi:D-alanyl-D-alanine carboxypeptidase
MNVMNVPRRAAIAAGTAAVLVTLLAAALLRPATAGAAHGPARLASIQRLWRQRAGIPGTVVAVQAGTGRPWVHADGTERRHGRTALSTGAGFRVASITKTFVAVVVLQLVHERRLQLDDPVAQYLPRAPGVAGVTVRELLDHTSGIPDYSAVDEKFGPGLLRDRDRTWTADELIALAATARPTFAPGTDYQYSNTNYLLLGQVIEAVTGSSWAAQVKARILDPLHLTGTSVPGLEPGPPVVPGYDDTDNDGNRENVETGRGWTSLVSSEGPAGAIVSTAADLAAFGTALFHGRLLDPAGMRLMATPGPFHPRSSNYGLGLEIDRPDDVTTVWGHSGYLPGFRSTLWYSPAKDLTVVVLADDGTANTPDLAELLLRAGTQAT